MTPWVICRRRSSGNVKPLKPLLLNCLLDREAYVDSQERISASQDIIKSDNYIKAKKNLDNEYNKIIQNYKTTKGKEFSNWSGKSLKEMAKDLDKNKSEEIKKNNNNIDDIIGENEIVYDYIMKYHSPIVHCDPSGFSPYVKHRNGAPIFDNRPSRNDIDMVLVSTRLLFSHISLIWINSFNINPGIKIMNCSKEKMAEIKIIYKGANKN
jgi:hypothetical protein